MIKLLSILLLLLSVTLPACAVLPLKSYPATKAPQPQYTCCMPPQHTFHFKGTTTDLTNCTKGMNCQSTFVNFKQTHKPDFYNRRYRLDSHIEMNGQVIDTIVMGFMDPYPSNFGVEYTINGTSCHCRRLTKQGEMLMLTCIETDYAYQQDTSIGVVTQHPIGVQEFNRRKHLNANTIEINSFLVEQILKKAPPLPYPDPYPAPYHCAIISMDKRTEVRDANGELIGVSSFSGVGTSFIPYNRDSDFIVPSYCYKC